MKGSVLRFAYGVKSSLRLTEPLLLARCGVADTAFCVSDSTCCIIPETIDPAGTGGDWQPQQACGAAVARVLYCIRQKQEKRFIAVLARAGT